MANITQTQPPPIPPILLPPPEVFIPLQRKKSTVLSQTQRVLYTRAWNEVKEKTITIYRNWCFKDSIDEISSVGHPCYFGNDLEAKLEQWVLESALLGTFDNVVIYYSLIIMFFVGFM